MLNSDTWKLLLLKCSEDLVHIIAVTYYDQRSAIYLEELFCHNFLNKEIGVPSGLVLWIVCI